MDSKKTKQTLKRHLPKQTIPFQPAIDLEKVKAFHHTIFTYYASHKRALPWRETNDRYCILVSEVMLQQTQVSRVEPKYIQWIKTFPTIKHLADAKLEQVLALWSGLGYNRRGKNLWETAKIVAESIEKGIPLVKLAKERKARKAKEAKEIKETKKTKDNKKTKETKETIKVENVKEAKKTKRENDEQTIKPKRTKLENSAEAQISDIDGLSQSLPTQQLSELKEITDSQNDFVETNNVFVESQNEEIETQTDNLSRSNQSQDLLEPLLNSNTSCECTQYQLPSTVEELQTLPGIGPYTARAILIFADNKNIATIDTNIRRILIHHFDLDVNMSEKDLFVFAERILPAGRSCEYHNALMDYGATFLTSRKAGIRPTTTQSTFKGSKRYYRGLVLKKLLGSTEKKLSKNTVRLLCLGHKEGFRDILNDLVKEGLVCVDKDGDVTVP